MEQTAQCMEHGECFGGKCIHQDDVPRIAKPIGGGYEFDLYVEAAVAQERMLWQGRERVHAAEKWQLREQNQRLQEILNGITALLPPPRTEHDGKVYEFQDPDANRTLRVLRDRIWAIVGSVAAIRNAQAMPK